MKNISVIVLFLLFETIAANAQSFIYKSEVEEQLFARLDTFDIPLEDLFSILSETTPTVHWQPTRSMLFMKK